jgi:hypothetical protein
MSWEWCSASWSDLIPYWTKARHSGLLTLVRKGRWKATRFLFSMVSLGRLPNILMTGFSSKGSYRHSGMHILSNVLDLTLVLSRYLNWLVASKRKGTPYFTLLVYPCSIFGILKAGKPLQCSSAPWRLSKWPNIWNGPVLQVWLLPKCQLRERNPVDGVPSSPLLILSHLDVSESFRRILPTSRWVWFELKSF